MPNYTIRSIQAADNAALARIIRATFIEHKANTCGTVYEDPTTDDLYHLFQQPGAACLVACIEGKVVGCAGIFPTPGLPEGCCEFVKFYLAPEARGIGLGKALMNQCIQDAKQYGYTQMYLESLPAFSSAIHLYIKAGFTPLPAALGNSGHFGCNIWMIKQLD